MLSKTSASSDCKSQRCAGREGPWTKGEDEGVPPVDEEKQVTPSLSHKMSWATKVSNPLPIS